MSFMSLDPLFVLSTAWARDPGRVVVDGFLSLGGCDGPGELEVLSGPTSTPVC